MSIFLNTFLFVLIAEMGDKTQLFAMACASKYKSKDVMIGISIAIIILNAIAVIAGNYISHLIPIIYVQIAAAVSFIIFGLLSAKPENDDEEVSCSTKNNHAPIITVALTFFISEFGDKTQLMAITMSAQYMKPFSVFFGAVLGMLIADGLGVIGGTYLAKYVPKKYINWGATVIFLTFGSITFYNSLKQMAPQFISLLYILIYSIVLVFFVYLIGFRKKKINE